jgi:O-antigen ligase
MSRSRAAWLALIAAGIALIPLTVIALRRGRSDVRLRRLLVLVAGAVLGAAAALVIPNTLDWSSDSPYLDTAKSVVNYKEGSGAGRLVQYATTARMTLHHPLLGVGPGNWAVEYPHFAKDNDPSLADNGMTSNPWPSSDWMTFLSERGPAAFALLALAMMALAADGFRGLREDATSDDRLTAAVLLSTLVVLLVVGTFDAVLLLPVPALCAWALLGALSQPSRTRQEIAFTWPRRTAALVLVAVLGGAAVARSAAQLTAMALFSTSTRTSQLERASALDAGSYRIHMRLANGYYGRGNCKKARAHASAAHALYPNAPAAKRIVARCAEGD